MGVKTLSALKLTGRVIKSSEGRKKSDQLFAVEIGGTLRQIGPNWSNVKCFINALRTPLGVLRMSVFFPFR